ncbi:MAG: hypothetical protein ACTSXP_17855, partial [Promethearchaeota archaeon]
MDVTNFVPFSSFKNARMAESRLSNHFLPRFAEILSIKNRNVKILPGQEDVTTDWQNYFESTIFASSWSVFPNLEIVLLLLEDDEFGREIKWFFSKNVYNFLDLKHLIILVEFSTSLLISMAQDPSSRLPNDDSDQPFNLSEALNSAEPFLINSNLFCFSRNSHQIIPPAFNLNRKLAAFLDQEKYSLAVSEKKSKLLNYVKSYGQKIVICWNLLFDLLACISTANERSQTGINVFLSTDGPLKTRFKKLILSILSVEIDIL